MKTARDAAGSAAPYTSLWRSRELIGFLALRNIRVRYRQAALGVLWVLLQPVATVLIFTVVFNRLARIGSEGIPYPLFALVGMVMWSYFSAATVRGSEVIVSNPELVRTKVSFPRVAAPAAAMFPPLVELAVSLALVVVLLVYYGVNPGPGGCWPHRSGTSWWCWPRWAPHCGSRRWMFQLPRHPARCRPPDAVLAVRQPGTHPASGVSEAGTLRWGTP